MASDKDVEIIVRPRTRAGRSVAAMLVKEVARALSHLEVGQVTLAGPDWGFTNGDRIAQIDRLAELELIANGQIEMLVRRGR